MRRIINLLFLVSFSLFAEETKVESNQAYYNGDQLILIGDVIVENPMGRVKAQKAVLTHDGKKTTSIEFPWIELYDQVSLTLSNDGLLTCDRLILNHLEMSALFSGNVSYTDSMGKIFANQSRIDYVESENTLQATKITLVENIYFIRPKEEQYALADHVVCLPKEQLIILKGEENRVLFYDKKQDMHLSARMVHAKRDPETQKESIQGIGEVRCIFGPGELERLKECFSEIGLNVRS